MGVTHLTHLQMLSLASTLIMMVLVPIAFFLGSTMLPMYRRISLALVAAGSFAAESVGTVWPSAIARDITILAPVLLLFTGYPYFRQFFLGREK